MAKARSNKPSDKTEAQDAKPEETIDAVTEPAPEETKVEETPEAAADESPAETVETAEADTVAAEPAEDVVETTEPEADVTPEAPELILPEAPAEAMEHPGYAEEKPEPAPAAAAPVARETVVERKGGFVPMLLGGAVAAALGFGAAQFGMMSGAEEDTFEQEARSLIETQSQQIAGLEAKLAEAEKALALVDLAPLTGALQGVEDQLSGLTNGQTTIKDSIAGFDSRLTALEKAPVADAVGPEAIAAYERELEGLRQAVLDQQKAVEQQKAEIQAMAEEALAANAEAADQAELATSRGAAAEALALVQEGKSFVAPLAILSENGITPPEGLQAVAEEGVDTLTALATDFPDAARDALAAARKANGGENGGFAGFLSAQLGARSVEPREGDDPDAVLSRAEAAVKAGDLDTALAEIATLPAPAQEALSVWTARAEARRDALAAAQSLALELNKE